MNHENFVHACILLLPFLAIALKLLDADSIWPAGVIGTWIGVVIAQKGRNPEY